MAMSWRDYMALKTEISSYNFFLLTNISKKKEAKLMRYFLSAKLQDAMIECPLHFEGIT